MQFDNKFAKQYTLYADNTTISIILKNSINVEQNSGKALTNVKKWLNAHTLFIMNQNSNHVSYYSYYAAAIMNLTTIVYEVSGSIY